MSEGEFVVVKRGKKGPVAPNPVPTKPPTKAPNAAKPKKTKPPPPGWAAPAKQQAAPLCDQSPARLGQVAAAKSTAAAERLPPWKKREPDHIASACQRSAASTGCPSGPPSDTASARSTSPHGGVDDRPQASQALGQAAAALLKRAQESQQEALRKKEAEQHAQASAAREHHGAALAQALEQDPRKVAEPAPPAAGPMQALATFAADYVAPAGGYLTASRGELVHVSYADGDWFYGQVADRAGWFARDAVILS